MARAGLVCLVTFLMALFVVLGLDAYTARDPELDESGLLSSLDRFPRTVPNGTRVKNLKIHRQMSHPLEGPFIRRPQPINRMCALHVAGPQIADHRLHPIPQAR